MSDMMDEESQGWISIETPPKNGYFIARFLDSVGTPLAREAHCLNGWFSMGDYYTIQIYPTHWMPMPDPSEVLS